MAEVITLKLPDTLARRARAEANRTNRRLEDVLLDWLNRIEETELSVESLSDDQVLALSNAQMDQQQNDELSDLLARNREGHLDEAARQHLDALMQLYRLQLIRKAQALKVAVDRGLRPPLN